MCASAKPTCIKMCAVELRSSDKEARDASSCEDTAETSPTSQAPTNSVILEHKQHLAWQAGSGRLVGHGCRIQQGAKRPAVGPCKIQVPVSLSSPGSRFEVVLSLDAGAVLCSMWVGLRTSVSPPGSGHRVTTAQRCVSSLTCQLCWQVVSKAAVLNSALVSPWQVFGPRS